MSVIPTAENRMGAYAFTFSYSGIMFGDDKTTNAEIDKSAARTMSVMNVFASIPGVSLIVGIARIIFSQVSAVFSDLESKPQAHQANLKALQEAQLVRGVLECCTIFSPLMLIIDIAMSILIASSSTK